jgi:hypothetical protein
MKKLFQKFFVLGVFTLAQMFFLAAAHAAPPNECSMFNCFGPNLLSNPVPFGVPGLAVDLNCFDKNNNQIGHMRAWQNDENSDPTTIETVTHCFYCDKDGSDLCFTGKSDGAVMTMSSMDQCAKGYEKECGPHVGDLSWIMISVSGNHREDDTATTEWKTETICKPNKPDKVCKPGALEGRTCVECRGAYILKDGIVQGSPGSMFGFECD